MERNEFFVWSLDDGRSEKDVRDAKSQKDLMNWFLARILRTILQRKSVESVGRFRAKNADV